MTKIKYQFKYKMYVTMYIEMILYIATNITDSLRIYVHYVCKRMSTLVCKSLSSTRGTASTKEAGQDFPEGYGGGGRGFPVLSGRTQSTYKVNSLKTNNSISWTGFVQVPKWLNFTCFSVTKLLLRQTPL